MSASSPSTEERLQRVCRYPSTLFESLITGLQIRERKEQALEALRLSELEVSLSSWQQRLREMETKLSSMESVEVCWIGIGFVAAYEVCVSGLESSRQRNRSVQ